MSESEIKQYANHDEMGGDLSRSITMQISPEAYERLFFQPTPARGDLAKRLGNPTLIGTLGFLIPYQTTIFCLLEWQGANSTCTFCQQILTGFLANPLTATTAISGSMVFLGGIAMVVAAICEFILGNSMCSPISHIPEHLC